MLELKGAWRELEVDEKLMVETLAVIEWSVSCGRISNSVEEMCISAVEKMMLSQKH